MVFRECSISRSEEISMMDKNNDITDVLVSIIIPIYNVEKYIGDCIRSIAGQTLQEFEVILVDDESKDTSVSIAEALLRQLSISFLTIHQKNQGQGVARNNGIAAATGEYVVCVDPDDTIAPDYLESLYMVCKKENLDVSFCAFRYVKESNRHQYERFNGEYCIYSRKTLLNLFLKNTGFIALPATMIKKSFIGANNISAPHGCRYSEDDYFLWKMFFFASSVGFVSKPLYNYYMHEKSTSTTFDTERILSGHFSFCELTEYLLTLNVEKEIVPYILPRVVLGHLRSIAQMCDYNDFYTTAAAMDYKENMLKLKSFPEWKVRKLAMLIRVSPYIFYSLVRVAHRLYMKKVSTADRK